MTILSQERITALRDYLYGKMPEGEYDLFFEDGPDRIVWVSKTDSDTPEVVVLTLQAARFEVAS